MTILAREKVIKALKGGDRIMVTHPSPDKASDRMAYTLVEAGRSVGARTFSALRHNLAPMSDGLFGDSQTYGWGGQ